MLVFLVVHVQVNVLLALSAKVMANTLSMLMHA